MGESAGGGSTMHQITAFGGKKGKVPFQQAIVQSPGFQMSPSNKIQENVYSAFLRTAGVSNLNQARNLSSEALVLANYQLISRSTPYGMFTFNPVVDGIFAPALPTQLLLRGQFDQSLKVMTAHNILEGLPFQDPFAQNETVWENDLRVYFPTISDDVVQYISKVLYPPPRADGSTGYTTYTERTNLMMTECIFTCNAYGLNRAYGNKTYSYFFTVPPSLHGQDVAYTYYNGPSASVLNDTLAKIMQRYETNFVMTGNPNAPGLPNFPMYGAGSTVLNLNISTIGPTKDPAANARCQWWQKGLYA
jgi:carboxylesterase type B